MNANQVLSDLFLEQEAILTFNNACILQLVAMLLTSCVIFNCYSGSTSNLQGVLQVVLVGQPNPHKEKNRKESQAKDSVGGIC